MKEYVDIINLISDIEKKLIQQNQFDSYTRSFNRLKQIFESLEIEYQIPLNEKYNDSRTDIEANITGKSNKNLKIVEVLKPIIYLKGMVYQKGVVIVEGE